ncbi:LAS seventeen-binding protein 3 [Seminavis robusta]|uniref:LAS seventeen-binding protein 3 n=1 Tax=Seminavis robusta TaxID=568900 RepID=A0A9N8E4R1_9STRA|nr:LAS seventeen-binding protein 3 [Seminavis robusta]|eukprot:Sro618_g176300.1 LAS seventeen-binding protein 3 (372) ;mRNA; r:38548-39663
MPMNNNKITKRANKMEGMIQASVKLLEKWEFQERLSPKVVQHAHGIAILEIIQAGFLFNGQIGTGVLLRHDKTTNTWGHPLAIGLTGAGAGISLGAEKKHIAIFLTREQMTQAMASDFSLRLGLQTSLVVMDAGEEMDLTAHVGNKGSGVSSAYASTLGFYLGVEANGSVLAPRKAVNEAFYGAKLTPKKIVFGQVEDAPACEALDQLRTKLLELSEAPAAGPSYAETIAHPFLKTTKHTNKTMGNSQSSVKKEEEEDPIGKDDNKKTGSEDDSGTKQFKEHWMYQHPYVSKPKCSSKFQLSRSPLVDGQQLKREDPEHLATGSTRVDHDDETMRTEWMYSHPYVTTTTTSANTQTCHVKDDDTVETAVAE